METTQLIWIIAVTLLGLLNIVWQLDLQTRMKRLEERYRRLSGASIEETGPQVGLGTLLAQIGSVRDRVEKLEALASQAQASLGHALRGVGSCATGPFPTSAATRVSPWRWWTARATALFSPPSTSGKGPASTASR